MKHPMLLLGLAAVTARAQITCQHVGNTTTCNDAPFGAPIVTSQSVMPQMNIIAAMLAKRQAGASVFLGVVSISIAAAELWRTLPVQEALHWLGPVAQAGSGSSVSAG